MKQKLERFLDNGYYAIIVTGIWVLIQEFIFWKLYGFPD